MLNQVVPAGRAVRVVACGPRNDAFRAFRSKLAGKNEVPILLVDSEEQVTVTSKWGHLKARDGWDKPEAAQEQDVFLMAQSVETWFVADTDGLADFYGRGFRTDKLPRNPTLESLAKQNVVRDLREATKDTKKGRYEKNHAFEILARIDATKVRDRCPHANQLFLRLETRG